MKNLILGALVCAAVTPAFCAVKPVDVKAAISKQIVPINIKDPVIIELVTVTQSPLRLDANGLQTPPGFRVIGTEESNKAPMPSKDGEAYKQRWTYKLMIEAHTSRLNGNYKAIFRVSSANPSSRPATTTYNVPFSLQSENFRSAKTVNGQ